LLERGADFHLKNNAGSTPLHIAASAGHVEVCLGLLERGADVNLSNKLDQTPCIMLHLLLFGPCPNIVGSRSRHQSQEHGP
jgi:ankyrin repeat protein